MFGIRPIYLFHTKKIKIFGSYRMRSAFLPSHVVVASVVSVKNEGAGVASS